MKTLREMDLENELWNVKRELAILRDKEHSLDKYDMIPAAGPTTFGVKELPMVALVSMQDHFAAPRKGVVMRAIGKEEMQFGYYLPGEVLYDRGHIEQALVTMHERFIQQILKARA